MYFLAMAVTVVSNLLYHVFQKATPSTVNPISSLIATYGMALILSLVAYPFFAGKISFAESIKELNWASYALGFAIIGLELGFLLAYRAGWNISLAALISNVAVTILLLPLGLLFFKETLSVYNSIGLVLCIAGLILINYKS
jgi:uncharacterized membrane protein